MNKTVFLFLVWFLTLTSYSEAKDFLGAPVVPQGKTINKTDARLEVKTRLSHDEALSYYREKLKGYEDIKFRDWKDSTYIEDDGKLAWHSITISKGEINETTVVIMKDNWTWIIGTLVLRYIGVFVVLLVLLLGMSISGRIISRSITKIEVKKGSQ
jgi:hypothetical protein